MAMADSRMGPQAKPGQSEPMKVSLGLLLEETKVKFFVLSY
jgi:hypothetical protein